MKLGVSSQIVIGTIDFTKSRLFFDKISYTLIEEGETSGKTKFALFSDGRQNILLEESIGENYGGLLYFNSKLNELIPELKVAGLELQERRNEQGKFLSAMFVSPDGLTVNIVNQDKPKGPDPMGDTNYKYGKFGEYAIDVKNMSESIEFWEKFGFNTLHKDETWQYAILTDGNTVLGLHEHEMNAITAITYFHEDMKSQMMDIKQAGVEMFDEIVHKGNEDAADFNVKSPSGQMFYFFTGKI